MYPLDPEEIEDKLVELREEHRELDTLIEDLLSNNPVNYFEVQRLKKKKLQLKDSIEKIESNLLPDIIA